LKFSNEAVSKAPGSGSREAIVDAAQRLFLKRGFGAVSMDDLAAAAGVARPALPPVRSGVGPISGPAPLPL
jgi:DNA-binding transcriptional regulator YbjK